MFIWIIIKKEISKKIIKIDKYKKDGIIEYDEIKLKDIQIDVNISKYDTYNIGELKNYCKKLEIRIPRGPDNEVKKNKIITLINEYEKNKEKTRFIIKIIIILI